jgi:hypothetical protein
VGGVERVHVAFAVKPAIHHHFDFAGSHVAKIGDKAHHGLHVRDVPRQLPVVERELGLLAEKNGEVDLGEFLVVLVLAVSYLCKAL